MHSFSGTVAGHILLVWLLALPGGYASASNKPCTDLHGLAEFYSLFEVVSVEKYRGGLTSRTDAEAAIGQEMELSPGIFRLGHVTIEQPQYETHCHPKPAEGEVTQERGSVFYGYGIERRQIEIISVFVPKETHPAYRFELISRKELWRLYDGWLYRLQRREPE